jgi:hypothetical protein
VSGLGPPFMKIWTCGIPTGYETGWTPELDRMILKTDELIRSVRNRTPIILLSSPLL